MIFKRRLNLKEIDFDKKLKRTIEKLVSKEFFVLQEGVNKFNSKINTFLIVPAFINEEQFEEWRKDKKDIPSWLREPFDDTDDLLGEYFYVRSKLSEYKLDREVLKKVVLFSNPDL